MKIKLNENGTYIFIVTTDEDRLLFQALAVADATGQKLKYGGRNGNFDDPDFHLFLHVGNDRFVLREDGEKEHLGFIRDAIYYGGRPTLISLADEDEQSVVVGIAKCKGCGTWKHGFAGHCTSCIEKCDHAFERQWTLSPALGQVMALICTKCGLIDKDDFNRLKKMEQIDRLVEVADETGTGQFIYPSGAKDSKYGLGVEVHVAQEAIRAAKD